MSPLFSSSTVADLARSSDWREHLDVGDIVSYRFPAAEPDLIGPPKARPCLVVERHDGEGHPRVVLAYGTTSPGRPRGAYDMLVPDRLSAPSSRLDRPTRFELDRRLSVAVASAALDVSDRTGSPVLGRLEGPALERLQAVRAQLHAEADIAAERRRKRADRARPAQDRRRVGEPQTRAASSLREPRWRATPGRARPLVEHRHRRQARPVLRLANPDPMKVPLAPMRTDIIINASPAAGSTRPTLTVRRPTSLEITTVPETTR